MSNTNPARGMRDFLPADIRRREYVISIIKEIYQKYGFEPLETPSVENIETLLGKYGEEGNQLVFKILKRGEGEKSGEADLALRYDLTVPFARVMANYKNDLPKFFKRFQIQPVWRADRPARGRFREFYQCDVDAVGSKSMLVEVEVCAAVSEVLQRLGFQDFTIKLNHRQVLVGMLDAANIAVEKHTDALTALDKLDKIGREGVLKEFETREIGAESATKILDFFEDIAELEANSKKFDAETSPEKINSQILSRLLEFIGDHEKGAIGCDEIKQILTLAKANNVSPFLKLDASLARGLSYYTGAIFEIAVPDLAGSLGGGGRYDGLIGMFGKEEIPACGFSLGLERIIVVMTEREMFPANLQTNCADVLVTIWDENTRAESLKLANELRETGLRVFLYPEADKLGKQFKYATTIGVNFVCILGDEEKAKGLVAIKNLVTGEQESVKREEVREEVADKIIK